jgi:hypothetical protein
MAGMGNLAQLRAHMWEGVQRFRGFLFAFLFHTFAALDWIGKKLWDWVAILFIVSALWAFGWGTVSVALAELIPSATELGLAALLFSSGTALLGVRICVAVWRTNELPSVAQRIAISAFVGAIVCVATAAGDRYLIAKTPQLLIEDALLLPRAPLVPYLPQIHRAHSGPPPVKDVVVTVVRVTHLATAAGEDTTAFVHLAVNALQALRVRMYEASAIQPFFGDDGIRQNAVEEYLWGQLTENEKNVGMPLQLSAHNQDVGFELAFRGLSTAQLNTINMEQGRYYFLAQLMKVDGRSALDVCFSINKDGSSVRYCRGHNT